MTLETIDDPETGLHIEDDPSLNKFQEEEEAGLDASEAAAGNEDARAAAAAISTDAPEKPDAGAPAGAANALKFHQWQGKDGEKDAKKES